MIDLFDFDWKMPKEMVYDEMDLAYSWARLPGIAPKVVLSKPFSEWIPQWFAHQYFVVKGIYILSFISFIFVLASKGKYFREYKEYLFAWIISFCGVLFFLQVPDIRFGFGFILSFTFIPFIIQKIRFNKWENNFSKLIYISCCFILLRYAIPKVFNEVETWRESDTKYVSYLIEPQTDVKIKSFLRSLASPVVERDIDGRIIYEETYCLDRCLPCTSYINEGLRFRGKSLEDGFMMEKGIKSYGGFYGSFFDTPNK
ncbi:MAG: hypothetical protein LBN74_03755 [Prevotella sp.]|jgi:hypothetical protein|nr:hypothetical protein [Prevotella sp.]